MFKYVLKRVFLLIPTLLIVLTAVFCLARMLPGSPVYSLLEDEDYTAEMVEDLKEEMGFNDPIIVQWARYIKDIFTGNWGNSYFNDTPVFKNMIAVWEPTLLITFYATFITVLIAVPLGIFTATHRNSPMDYLVTTLSTATMVVPGFCVGLLFCYFFGYKLGWFPTVGYVPIAKGGIWQSLRNVTMPSVALGLSHVASLTRFTRSSMLDVLNQDYIRTARAKGLRLSQVYYKHALKNTLPIVGTMIVGSFAGMLGGASVTEKVFNIQGMGTLMVSSLSRRDYPQEQAIVVFVALVSLGVDLLMDIMYKALDPRIEYE